MRACAASCLTHGSPSAVPSVGEDAVWGRTGARAAGRRLGRTGALLARGAGQVQDITQLWLPEAGLERLAPSLPPEGLVAVRSPFPLRPRVFASAAPRPQWPGGSLLGREASWVATAWCQPCWEPPGHPHFWPSKSQVGGAWTPSLLGRTAAGSGSVSHSCSCPPDPSGLSSSEFLAPGWSREPARGGEHGSRG